MIYVSGPNNCWVGAFPIRQREFLNVLTSNVSILAGGISYYSLAHMQNRSLYHAYSEKLMACDVICHSSFSIILFQIRFFCLIPAFLLFICFEMKDAHEKFKDLHMPIKKRSENDIREQ